MDGLVENLGSMELSLFVLYFFVGIFLAYYRTSVDTLGSGHVDQKVDWCETSRIYILAEITYFGC